MNTWKKYLIITLCLGMMLPLTALTQKEKTVDKTFTGISSIEMDLVLGNCQFKKSGDAGVHVRLVYTHEEDRFEPVIKQSGTELNLEERFHGKDGEGYSRWLLEIPDGLEIEIETATGDMAMDGIDSDLEASSGTGSIEVTNSRGEFELNSGTGKVEVRKSSGEFELNSGTGRVVVEDCQGKFDAGSGTGKVTASHITLESKSEFNSGTGEVEVIAPEGKKFTLEINSGTNDAILNMKGQPLQGYFEFRAGWRKGDIECPEKFDKEEEFGENGDGYIKKWFTRGGDQPRYLISTGTGTAELVK